MKFALALFAAYASAIHIAQAPSAQDMDGMALMNAMSNGVCSPSNPN